MEDERPVPIGSTYAETAAFIQRAFRRVDYRGIVQVKLLDAPTRNEHRFKGEKVDVVFTFG